MAYRLGDVIIDVITSTSYSSSTPATSHALEDNTEISDHITKDPKTLSISCIIIDPYNNKRDLIEKYQDEGRILNFTFLETLDSVVIENFNINRSSDIKRGYEASIDFKKIRLSRKKVIPISSGLVAKAMQNKKQLGLHVVKDTASKGVK